MKHVGVLRDPGYPDHSEEREIGEKRSIWGKAGCVCGLLGVPRHGDPRAVSRSPTARAEGTR